MSSNVFGEGHVLSLSHLCFHVINLNCGRQIMLCIKWIRREYSTSIGNVMSVGRRRICVHSLVFKLANVVVANTIPQVDKARRLSVHWKYYVLSLCFSLRVFFCMVFMFIIGSYMDFVYSKSASVSPMVFL